LTAGHPLSLFRW